MSIKYNKPEDVPNAVLCERLNALSDAVTRGKEAISDEFTRRIPAEVDRDADIVLAEAARRIKMLENRLKPLTEQQIVQCIMSSGCLGTVKLSYEAGPLGITRTTVNADKLVKSIERAHGIGIDG